MEEKMRYANIIENDIVDSISGINVSFWCQGCLFHCPNCHNPQTWDLNGGQELPQNYKEIILELLHKNGIDRGLSILGGEPLLEQNRQIVSHLIDFIKNESPNTIIYLWSGFTYKQLKKSKDLRLKNILNKVDYFIDGLYDESKRDVALKLRGSSNQNVYQRINNKLKKIEI